MVGSSDKPERKCEYCGKPVTTDWLNGRFCNHSCMGKLNATQNWLNPEYRKKMSDTARKTAESRRYKQQLRQRRADRMRKTLADNPHILKIASQSLIRYNTSDKGRDEASERAAKMLRDQSNDIGFYNIRGQLTNYRYGGVRFRSLDEMEFAKFCDENDLAWKYEPEIFKLRTGCRYTPDFYLPSLGVWVEINNGCEGKKAAEFRRQNLGTLVLIRNREFASVLAYKKQGSEPQP